MPRIQDLTALGAVTDASKFAGANTGTGTFTGAQIKTYIQGSAATSTIGNLVINGGFAVNQRAYVSGVALASGAFGHDRWKAGSGGATYAFAQSGSPLTTITITAGSLVHVVEGANLELGTYTVSWSGTALAKLNGATAAASPITTTLAAGTNVTIEFLTGTVGAVRLDAGSVAANPATLRHYAIELTLCQRFYWRLPSIMSLSSYATGAGAATYQTGVHPVSMRVAPSVAYTPTGTNASSTTITADSTTWSVTIIAAGSGAFGAAFAGISFSAEL